MKALRCILLAFLIGCAEVVVATASWATPTHNATTSVDLPSSNDSAHGVGLDLPIKYHKSVAGYRDTCEFKDRTGRVVTPAIYTVCGEFYDGMAYVTLDYDTIGYANHRGEVSIPAIHPIFFDFTPDLRHFSEG